MLNRESLNSVTTDDPNFLDLRAMANDSGVVEVRTASGVVVKGAWQPFDHTSTEAMKAEVARLGGDPAGVTQGFSFLGYTPETGSRAAVVLSDGTGRAKTATAVELAVTTAHELYGHALPRLKGRPWKHEFTTPPGLVDHQILDIESRTTKIY